MKSVCTTATNLTTNNNAQHTSKQKVEKLQQQQLQ